MGGGAAAGKKLAAASSDRRKSNGPVCRITTRRRRPSTGFLVFAVLVVARVISWSFCILAQPQFAPRTTRFYGALGKTLDGTTRDDHSASSGATGVVRGQSVRGPRHVRAEPQPARLVEVDCGFPLKGYLLAPQARAMNIETGKAVAVKIAADTVHVMPA